MRQLATAKEREWWQERKIDPAILARALWLESRKSSISSVDPVLSVDPKL
jgi:hypothetical protein